MHFTIEHPFSQEVAFRKDPRMTDEALRRYNFGRASSRCELVYGAERPGYVHLTRDQPATPRGKMPATAKSS